MTNNEHEVATQIATRLGDMVNNDQISPPEVLIGALRGATVFWMGCVNDGTRVESLNVLRQFMGEEIDNLIRGIANGMVPA
jgi:hypothetical protein